MKTAIVYWSGTGNTEEMAKCLAEGVTAKGGEAEIFHCSVFEPSKLVQYDSLALGCPSMGAEQLEESEFQPFYDSIKAHLKGKPVVLFGSYGWGSGEWMDTWEADCKEAGADVKAAVICNLAPDSEAADNLRKAGEALV